VNDALDNLVKTGMLKVEPASRTEVDRFVAHAMQALADASLPGLSATGRFEFAYTAAHALALAALRANGYRPGDGRGHRAIVFLSLVDTIGTSDTLASTLNRYHTRRNKSEYFASEAITEREAADLLSLAKQLVRRVASKTATVGRDAKPG
jgi:uncharacterized protein (UPF0332 family)